MLLFMKTYYTDVIISLNDIFQHEVKLNLNTQD